MIRTRKRGRISLDSRQALVVENFLERNVKQCPCCHSENWCGVAELGKITFHSQGVQPADRYVISVTCSKCSNISFFCAVALKLVEEA